MKNLLFTFFGLLCLQANAQYFQSTFGAAATNENNMQMVPSLDAAGGYVMVGNHTPAPVGSVQQVYVVRSDNNGATPAPPFFNNTYALIDPATSLICPTYTFSVDEINVGGGLFEYVVTGVFIANIMTNDYDVFAMKLSATGNVIWAFRYDQPNYGFKDPKVKLDATSSNILITGRCADYGSPGRAQDIYALSINATSGCLNWFQVYDMTFLGASQNDGGTDIIDNPYTPGQCLVVGYAGNDGLLLTLNSANGTPLAVTSYNLGALGQYLTSIRVSGNPLIPNAFCVSGNAAFPVPMQPAQQDAWTMLIDQTGAIAWSTTHDNSVMPLLNNTAWEIMERFNTFGLHEYYTAGSLANAPNTDVHVLKLNNFGLLVPGGEFIYGTPFNNEQGNSVRMSNTGGITVSATNNVAGGEQMLINSYFNGVNPCNTAINAFASNAIIPALNVPGMNLYSVGQTKTLTYSTTPLGQTPVCFAPMVIGGNNAKSSHIAATKKDDGFNFKVMGNGESGTNAGDPIQLQVQSSTGQLTAKIIDVVGREYACKLNNDGNGNYSISSNITAKGTYYIVLSDGKESRSKTIFVK